MKGKTAPWLYVRKEEAGSCSALLVFGSRERGDLELKPRGFAANALLPLEVISESVTAIFLIKMKHSRP